MTRAAHHRMPAVPTTQLRSWAGYAAAAWALVFAGPHFYWGVGGAVGLDTALNRKIVEGRSGRFLFLWQPWFTVGAVAWGALAGKLRATLPVISSA